MTTLRGPVSLREDGPRTTGRPAGDDPAAHAGPAGPPADRDRAGRPEDAGRAGPPEDAGHPGPTEDAGRAWPPEDAGPAGPPADVGRAGTAGGLAAAVGDLAAVMSETYRQWLDDGVRALLASAPVILAMFTPQGGRMVLHRPGAGPREAGPPPPAYELTKAVAHGHVALYARLAGVTDRPLDRATRDDLTAAAARVGAVAGRLRDAGVGEPVCERAADLLGRHARQAADWLDRGVVRSDELARCAREVGPQLAAAVAAAADVQVGHWMAVLDGWRADLGDDWPRVHAATNCIYVTRRNNVLFTVLAQFMGAGAIGERLLLVETTDFTMRPDDLLQALTRVWLDRRLGSAFFGEPFVMDVELMGAAAQDAVRRHAPRFGLAPVLPPLAPFRSDSWPWPHDPRSGTGPRRLEDLLNPPA